MSALAPDEPRAYPVRLSMAYPERLSRLSTAFRLILAIPVLIFVALLTGGSGWSNWGDNNARGIGAGIGGSIVVAIWATILVRGTIPRWLFDFHVAVQRFTYRAYSYLALLTDRYPAFEGDWDLRYDVDYPGRLSRWRLLFWKVITAIPHFFILVFLWIAAAFVILISWFIILFTGRFPRGLHAFVVGVMRWGARVTAYVESLTDEFPPYSLEEDAGPVSRGAVVGSAVIGSVVTVLALVGLGIGIAVLVILATKTKSVDLAYADATSGSIALASSSREMDNVIFTLVQIDDTASVDVLEAPSGYRLVEVDFTIEDDRVFRSKDNTRNIERDVARLKTSSGNTLEPVLITLDGTPLPRRIPYGQAFEGRAFFEVKTDQRVREARFYPGNFGSRHIAWKFR